jgi:hypothetical protein
MVIHQNELNKMRMNSQLDSHQELHVIQENGNRNMLVEELKTENDEQSNYIFQKVNTLRRSVNQDGVSAYGSWGK